MGNVKTRAVYQIYLDHPMSMYSGNLQLVMLGHDRAVFYTYIILYITNITGRGLHWDASSSQLIMSERLY